MYYFYFRSGCYDFVNASNLSLPLSSTIYGSYNPCNCTCFDWDANYRCQIGTAINNRLQPAQQTLILTN